MFCGGESPGLTGEVLARSYGHLTNFSLLSRYVYFKLAELPFLPSLLSRLYQSGRPISSLLTPLFSRTVYSVFCGGASFTDALPLIHSLQEMNIMVMVDYAVEHSPSPDKIRRVHHRWKEFVKEAASSNIHFIALKVSGLIPPSVLEEVSRLVASGKKPSIHPWREYEESVSALVNYGVSLGIRWLIDAEESWIQPAIDYLALQWMRAHNRKEPLIYTTIQCYLTDAPRKVRELLSRAHGEGWLPAIKLVRGAYVQKERERARLLNYPSPLLPSKRAVDTQYNTLLKELIRFTPARLCVATHNLASTCLALTLTEKEHAGNRVWFSHLLGMADPLTHYLALRNQLVAKFIPIGPVSETIPYLLRRLEENSGIHQQFSREKGWILMEMRRRTSLPSRISP